MFKLVDIIIIITTIILLRFVHKYTIIEIPIICLVLLYTDYFVERLTDAREAKSLSTSAARSESLSEQLWVFFCFLNRTKNALSRSDFFPMKTICNNNDIIIIFNIVKS